MKLQVCSPLDLHEIMKHGYDVGVPRSLRTRHIQFMKHKNYESS